MKRPRSYGEDLDESADERKGIFKDWVRRDQDPDRPPSHRRFHPKSDSSRKDRSFDDDRELLRAPRNQRSDHEADGFDRRRGYSFDRYRDGSSPRGSSYGSGDRLHGSESISVSRREFPKGFRLERDRSRRDGSSSGSSWRRSGGGKEAGDGELRSPSVDSVGRENLGVSKDRGSMRSKESSSRKQSTSVETAKAAEEEEEEVRRESCSSTEMEEGELKPDREPESEQDSDPLIGLESQKFEGRETEGKIVVSAATLENKGKFYSDKKSEFDGDDACDGKEEGKSLENDVADQVVGIDWVEGQQNGPVKESSENRIGGREGEGDGDTAEVEANLGGEKGEIHEEGQLCQEEKHQDEEHVVDEEGEGIPSSLSPHLEKKLEGKHKLKTEFIKEEVAGIDLGFEQKEENDIDVEFETEGNIGLLDSSKKVTAENNQDEVTLKLMTDKPVYNYKQKGKSLAVVTLSNIENSVEEEDSIEGPSGRGFELVFCSDFRRRPEKANCGDGVVIGKLKDEKQLKLEPLDLSLSLPNLLPDQTSKPNPPCPNSSGRVRSIQSLPSSSFRTNSDGFTTSMSFSGSQTFTHNPSCSLIQNSHENFENSVGSRPLFQEVDQGGSNVTVWRGQSLNEPKRKGGAGLLIQRVVLNGNGVHPSPQAMNGQNHLKSNDVSQQSSLPRQSSPIHSHGSDDTRSEHSRDMRCQPTRDRSSSGGEFVLNSVGFGERIVFQIVTEHVHVVGRMVQSMTEQSVAYLKETVCEMVANADKLGQLHALQAALQRRSDLTMETMPKCHRTVLEILVALKTALPDFLRRTKNIPSSDLIDIYFNLKCRNLACRSILPVDDCDCKVCVQKNGFCSACMCLVCSKFDMASNTCSWVGCDVCLHWCHTDCGLQESHIRNGLSTSGAQGLTEMQFHCVACNHPSEMLGFVKEVFKTCAKDWKAETLAKELHYVRRIFSASSDVRGKKLHDVADQMLAKLENANLSQVINYVMSVLTEIESNSNRCSSFPPKEPPRKNAEESNAIAFSSKETKWFEPVSLDKAPCLEQSGVPSSMVCDQRGRKTRDDELQINVGKKPVVDELESVVKFKQAEARMYQERADAARREAEGLKRIAKAKNVKIEEDYASRVTKLRLAETGEKRRQKIEELQALERVHREYFNMKMRMEAGIKDLLLKMESTKCNFNT